MRILILHSRYQSGPASGENRVVQDEVLLLREGGHIVKAWVPTTPDLRGIDLVRAGVGAVWSRRAVSETRRLARRLRPDVVHVHNLFPMLSPAVLRAVVDEGVPVVMTLHNYRLMCLPATLLRDGRVCHDCVGRIPWPGVLHRCYRGSALASLALASSITTNSALGTFDRVALFLAVSGFVRDQHVRAGLPGERIIVKTNFAWPAEPRDGPGSYFLYLGRLSPEKGIRPLVEVWRREHGRLLIVGTGPEETRLRVAAGAGVEVRGPARPDQVPSLLRGARALVLPSLWHDPAPRVVPEAFATGVPVVANSVGGLPEMVTEGETGLLADPADRGTWAAALSRLMGNTESLRLGAGALQAWRERFSPEVALANLEDAYRQAAGATPSC